MSSGQGYFKGNLESLSCAFGNGYSQISKAVDHMKNHKLATISALVTGLMGFYIYLDRDQSAPTTLSALAEPLEHITNHCFTNLCENANNMRLALEGGNLEKILSLKDLVRMAPRGVNENLWLNFNTQVAQSFFEGKNKMGDKFISILEFLKHPMFVEGYTRGSVDLNFSLENLVMQEHNFLSGNNQKSQILTFAQDLQKIVDSNNDEINLRLMDFSPRMFSQRFMDFLKSLQDETGVFFSFLQDKAEVNSLLPDEQVEFKDILGLQSSATHKEVQSKCRHLLASLHPDNHLNKNSSKMNEEERSEKWELISKACNKLGWRKVAADKKLFFSDYFS